MDKDVSSRTTTMAQPRLSTGDLDLMAMLASQARLDDQTLAELRAIASSPLVDLPPCRTSHLNKVLRTMMAVLPRRNADDLAGELFAAAYEDALWQFPGEAITWLGRQAMRECRWFPTIAECLERLQGWTRDDGAVRMRSAARALVRREEAARNPVAEEAGFIPWKPEPGELEKIKRQVAEAFPSQREQGL